MLDGIVIDVYINIDKSVIPILISTLILVKVLYQKYEKNQEN